MLLLLVDMSHAAGIVIHSRLFGLVEFLVLITIKDLWLGGQDSWMLSDVFQGMNLVRII
jgi:hypothetical protein